MRLRARLLCWSGALMILSGCASPFEKTPVVTHTPARFDPTSSTAIPASDTTNFTYAVSPELQKWIDGAKQLNSAVNPTPASPLVNLALGGLSLGLAAFARYKSKQAELVPTLIEGIESAPNNKDVKVAVRNLSIVKAQSKTLHRAVRTHV